MTDSSGAKEYEDVMQKVGIWLGKRLMIEEEINVEEKPTDEQPDKSVVPSVVVVPAPNVDFRIQFTTNRKFKQEQHSFSDHSHRYWTS
jgi:hypothetical protein